MPPARRIPNAFYIQNTDSNNLVVEIPMKNLEAIIKPGESIHLNTLKPPINLPEVMPAPTLPGGFRPSPEFPFPTNQLWSFEPAPGNAGWWLIRNFTPSGEGFVMDASSPASINVAAASGPNPQNLLWTWGSGLVNNNPQPSYLGVMTGVLGVQGNVVAGALLELGVDITRGTSNWNIVPAPWCSFDSALSISYSPSNQTNPEGPTFSLKGSGFPISALTLKSSVPLYPEGAGNVLFFTSDLSGNFSIPLIIPQPSAAHSFSFTITISGPAGTTLAQITLDWNMTNKTLTQVP
jgi:hypothetical protein